MSSNIAVLVVAALLGAAVVGSVLSGGRAPGVTRFFTSGGMLLLAMFCGYGFLAAGELSGRPEMLWKTGYAIAGGISLLGAIYLAWKKR